MLEHMNHYTLIDALERTSSEH